MKIVLIFLFLSVTSLASPEEVLRLTRDFSIHQKEFKEGQEILKPRGLWIHLMSFKGKNQYCLLYKTPFREKKGELKLVKKVSDECLENKISWYQGKVDGLKITTHPKFQISYKVLEEEKKHSFIFFNRIPKSSFELFDPPQKKKFLPGLHLLE